MSEAKRCTEWCGTKTFNNLPSYCNTTDPHFWCSPECRDNRRRMHEGEARDPSDDVKLCCPEAKPVTNAAGQPRYWTCAIHPGVAYAPEPLRHAADFRGEGVTRTWGTLCGAPIQTSLVAGTGAVNCPACRLKAAPAPAVEGEPPKKRRTCVCHDDCDAAGSGAVHVADQKPAGEPGEDHSQHDGCAWPDEPCNQRRRPAGEPHEMTLAEACEADEAGADVEVAWFTTPGHWMPFDPDKLNGSPWAFVRSKYRLKPAPVLSRVQVSEELIERIMLAVGAPVTWKRSPFWEAAAGRVREHLERAGVTP